MPIIKVRPLAEQDILAGTRYLESNAGFDVANRFFTATWEEFESLSRMPQIGYLCNFKNSQMRDIRRWPVTGFERWLIFYQALDSGIHVARVLHGARDIQSLFE